MSAHHAMVAQAVVVALALSAVLGCRAAAAPTSAGPEPPKQSLKEAMRMPWARPEEGCIRTWLLCGPFLELEPGAGRTSQQFGPGHDTDYLAPAGGEAAARPAEGQAVARPDGSSVAWTSHTSPSDAVNLETVFAGGRTAWAVAYAYATITSAKAGPALLLLGSDDSVKVYLNGRLVHDHRIGRPVVKDEDAVPVELAAGGNALLIKVENMTGGWGFAARILSEDKVAGLEAGEPQPRLDAAPEAGSASITVHPDTGIGSLATKAQPVRVEVLGPGGRVIAAQDGTRGAPVTFDTAAWPDGPCEVRVSCAMRAGYTALAYVPWYKGDWMAQVRQLLDDCDDLTPDGSDMDAKLRLGVIGQLVVHGLGGDPRKPPSGEAQPAAPRPDGWQAIHATLMEHRELQLSAADGFVRLAWTDDVDGSPQFARAYLPPSYDPKARWPMVVSLHGYNPDNPEYVAWWETTKRHDRLAQRHGVIMLEPHGRGNTSYNGIGDRDVLKAIALAKKTFSVDEDRVYLIGYSMGGGGTWHVGTRHPELFAAIGPVYGGWDYHVYLPEQVLAKLTPRQAFQAERESSFAQAEALLTTPVFVNHGDSDDLVDVAHSRYVVRMLQRWGYEVRYWEHPGGHGPGALGAEDELMRWLLAHRRNADPDHVRVRAASLASAQAHWVRVEQSEDPFAFIVADARVSDRHTVRIDTENVLQVRLTPGAALVDRDRPVRVVWNGMDAGEHRFEGDAVTLRAASYAPAKLYKTPDLAGPMDAVTTTPFAIVMGTASQDPLMRAFCRVRAESARDAWRQWQHVEPRFFLDTEITDEQVRRYSLYLFGGPDENLVTRRLVSDLPLKITPQSVTVGGQTFAARDTSVALAYPHPLNPDRYVLVSAGTSATGMFFADRMPRDLDFAVAEPYLYPQEGPVSFRDVCTAAGCFDGNWQYAGGFVTRGDPAVRAKTPLHTAPKYLSAAVPDRRLMLSELLPTSARGSFDVMVRDLNWSGAPIALGGKTYARGIAVQAWQEPCSATFDLTGGSWKRLKATIGIELSKKPEELEPKEKDGTRDFFVVRGDGKELYRSPTFRWDSAPVEMDVDVSGVKTLELAVGNEVTWFNAASSLDWAEVRLEK